MNAVLHNLRRGVVDTTLGLFMVTLAMQPLKAEPPLHPLSTTNLSPVILIQGLPASHDPHIVTGNDWQTAIDVAYLNNFTHGTLNNERVFFDGETTRVALSFKTSI
ncbi:MAG: hypothetical protein PVH04_10005, partial [Gammaproteobacteria bacterium]